MKNSAPSHSILKSLETDFAAFRARCRPHAPIPEQLRQAVFVALDSGIEPALVTKPLGLSRSQIAIWRRARVSTEMATAAESQPRILNVIPPSSVAGMPSGLRVSYEPGRLLLEFSF